MKVKDENRLFPKTTPYLGLILLAVLIAAMVLPPAFSELSRNVTIGNTGKISTNIAAKSGSLSDIQAAINTAHSASGGGRVGVTIPAGHWNWTAHSGVMLTGYENVDIYGAGKDITILDAGSWSGASVMTLLYVTGTGAGGPRISNLTLTCSPQTDGGIQCVALERCKDFRVDNCHIDNGMNAGILSWKSRGVIDHCDITYSTFASHPSWQWGYGVQVAGDQPASYGTWQTVRAIDYFLGKYDTIPYSVGLVYIEDCNFTSPRHAVSSSQGGFYVIRHCTLTSLRPGCYLIDVHGYTYTAGYGCECYNNAFNSFDRGVQLRGGRSVIYNNTFTGCTNTNMLLSNMDGTPTGNPEMLQQTGVWGNTFNSGTILYVDYAFPTGNIYADISPYNNIASYPFRNYVPYTYPHPLVSG